ncbi:MAG: energy transducer TonB [Nitrospiraceae bacterium]|nr:energy transducer TonB [Nitrospiraceae bacterium]
MTFEKTLFLSVLFHAVILSALAITLKKPFIIPQPFQVDLVSPAGRFDKPAESRKPVTERQLAQTKAPRPVPVEKKASMAMPEKRPERHSHESDALIAKELARIQQSVDIERAVNGIEKKVKLREKVVINKSSKSSKNKGHAGGSAQAGAGDNTALKGYLSQVKGSIWRNWYLPDAKVHGIEATVTIDILKDGTLVAKGFEKRSGNGLFDQSAIRAIQRTAKVPPPPGVLPPGGLEVGFVFNPD